VLGLLLECSHGPLHRHLTGHNILFNEDGVIQITDFHMNGLRDQKDGKAAGIDVIGFAAESWTPNGNVETFAEFLRILWLEF
jgi:tRNA A-37 threonylcarbamoyl transferase component Bud32